MYRSHQLPSNPPILPLYVLSEDHCNVHFHPKIPFSSADFKLMPEFFNRIQLHNVFSPINNLKLLAAPMFPESNSNPLSWCQRLSTSGFHLLSLNIMACSLATTYSLYLAEDTMPLKAFMLCLSSFISFEFLYPPFVSSQFLLIVLDPA